MGEDGDDLQEVWADGPAAPAAAAVWDDKPGVPWTAHTVNSLIRVSSTLMPHLIATRVYQLLVEWCATPGCGP